MTTTAIDVKHVAMYLRISQEKKSEGVETLTNHRNLLTDYASRNGFTYEEYSEVLSGGKSDLGDRPQLQRLLSNIEKYDAIMVVELSRLSRNGLISETVLQYCVDYDKPIITPEKVYDLANNQNDVLTFRFGSLIASQEHALIGKRSKNNKIQMAKQGLHISGNVPFGYKRNNDTKKLEINEKEAETIRYIFKLHNEGHGSFKIRDILNNEGYKSAKGKAFNLPSIKRIIKNPAYKGTVVFNDRKRIKENGKYVYKNIESYVVDNAHPPIIEPSEWDKANEIRDARAIKAGIIREKPAIKSEVTMLKDLVFCGVCGRKMSIRKDNKGDNYFIKVCHNLLPDSTEKCNNAGINLQFVIDTFLEELDKLKEETKRQLEGLLSMNVSNFKEDMEKAVTNIDNHIKEQQKQFENLINLALQGIFTNEEILSKKQELNAKIETLKLEREAAITKMNDINISSMESKLREIIQLMENFKEQDTEIQNEHLKTFVKAVHYYRKMPEEVRSLSTRNPIRKNYPFEIKIELY